MFCIKCGNKNVDGAAFCHKCGTKVTSSESNNLTQSTNQLPNSSIPSSSENMTASNLILGLHKQRMAIVVASTIGTLSMFMPWVTTTDMGTGDLTLNAFQYARDLLDVTIVLIVFAIPLVSVMLGDKSKQLVVYGGFLSIGDMLSIRTFFFRFVERGHKICIWAGIIGTGYGIWFINNLGSEVYVREGAYLMILSCAAITVCTIFLSSRSERKTYPTSKISATLDTGEVVIASCACAYHTVAEDLYGFAISTNMRLIIVDNESSGQICFSVPISEMSRIEEDGIETVIHINSGDFHVFNFYGNEHFKNTLKNMRGQA